MSTKPFTCKLENALWSEVSMRYSHNNNKMKGNILIRISNLKNNF